MAPTSNRTVNHEKKILLLANGCKIILNSPLPVTMSKLSLPIISPETSENDYTIYEHRLRTFNNGWTIEFIAPELMAKAGFYYSGIRDRVRCSYCSKDFEYWQPGDDPADDHRNKSPQCPFFKPNKGYDVCGCYDVVTHSNSIEESSETKQFLDSMGIVQQIKSPTFKDFVSLEARLKSYEICPQPFVLDPLILSKAGFYYLGNGQNDFVMCFFCSQGLRDWDEKDDPWEEHSRWSPKCSFLLLSKGKEFVMEACKNMIKRDPVKQNPSEENADQRDDPNPNSLENRNINVDPKYKLEITVQEQATKPEPIASLVLSHQDLSGIADPVLCKICYKDKMEVAFIPCGHVIACIQCAITLDQCAICRNPFNMVMRVYIYSEQDKRKDQVPPCSSSQSKDDEPPELMLCKICHIEEMEAAFIPCKHVSACVKCATDMKECPICSKEIFATMQVYL